jgi:hypothetical protein
MTDETQAILQAALALPPEQRAELAEQLLDSLRAEPQRQRKAEAEDEAIRPSDVRDDE